MLAQRRHIKSVEPELPSTVSHLTRQPSATPVTAAVVAAGLVLASAEVTTVAMVAMADIMADITNASHSRKAPEKSPAFSKSRASGMCRRLPLCTSVRHPNAIEIGDKVPDFEVTIAGQTRKLSELQRDTAITADGTISLTFWCSFCHSCRDVEHDLDQLARQYKGKVGVIAVDASFGETTANVAEFAQKEGLMLPIALNESGNVADIFGVATTTTTVVIDSDGVLRYRGQFGNKSRAYAADAIDAVLTGKQMPVKETEHRG